MTGAEAKLEPGDVLRDTYRIVRRIASGGFGVVYEARHVRLHERRVAVKVLIADRAASEEFLPRFRREAEIGASLSHPNIVAVTDWNTLPSGLPYFVMEYLEGVSLGDRMAAGPIRREEVTHIIRGIGAALEVAHARGIIHRDLKPSNVFLADPADSGQKLPAVKVLDFGISKLITDQTLRTSSPKLLGTPRYMAPEQAKGLAVTPAADQFALAAITYEMYAGEPAFRGDTLESIVYNVVHEPPKPLADRVPGLEPHVVETINRAMSKNPEHRFVDVRDFLDALDGKEPRGDKDRVATTAQLEPADVNVQEVDPTKPLPATLDHPLETAPRHRTATWIGVAVLALIAVVSAWSMRDGRLWNRSPVVTPTRDLVTSASPAESATATEAGSAGTSPTAVATTPASPVSPQPTAVKTRTPVPAVTPVSPVTETAEVREKLDRVAKLYDDAEYAEALRIARQSLILQETPRGYRYITLCHCALADLGNAKASFFRVATADRASVQSACATLGIDL